jgi:Xaa-Pro aminopeptidase
MSYPLLGFSPETFSRRRARVLPGLEDGALILPSAPIRVRSRDTQHRYRPDSELFYLTGCPDLGVVALLMGSKEGHRFVLFVPDRDLEAEVWSGPRLGPAGARERYGADEAHPIRELEEELPRLLESPARVFFRLGIHGHLDEIVLAALRRARTKGPRRGEGPRSVVDPGEVLDELRLIKDPEELTRIRRAAAVTVAGFREAMESARPGMGEWEVESLIESAFRRRGARGPAFPTIVGSGRNGCTLHYTSNQSTIQADDLVLLDGGAEVDLYAGDVTRTFPANGRFSAEQRLVYDLVRAAHGAAVEAVRPGSTVAEVHAAAVGELTRGLVELELLSGDVPELVAQGAFRPFFPHQTSHWLGLDVHDVGDSAKAGSSRTLEAGMVLTVEPGLYFSPEPEGPGSPFSGIGVRLEDDVLVTEEGAENLTDDLPIDPEEVEALVGGGA